MADISVDVVAADRAVWSGTARSVTAPAHDGSIGILAGHTPLLALLSAGTVVIRPAQGSELEISVTGGFLSVDSDQITVVADEATIVTA
ncbi:F0F1 ATP synthase subunit epsilon [Sanguibacter sp. HDW7]|uniref:F0F1 ATP synthase subunit epsilon n=1 Tax=Sanguibacter sp. HDW7 TaxID=2714931 RepID=UPI00140C83B7|nr:F0F1 ATP synthase subunit epsilon [Sanguibacter sp. HDW7]QIK83993.1 F0F1 ATP synthase subunit epsilon [Sanguibacter sp. HDW7]